MHIQRQHSLGKEEARRRVDGISASLAADYNLQSRWDGDELKFNGSGVSGCIAVSDDCVDVDVKLGFALMMLESTIRSSIEGAMDKHLS